MVELPSVTVTAKQEKQNPIFGGNPLFDHTFADLAGGPLIEAIFWRHHFLTHYPQEDAVILTTVRGNRLVSATTVYSQGGKIYASSNALGEKVSVPGLGPEDLHRKAGLAQAAEFIDELRQQLLSAPPAGFNLGYAILRAEESGGYGAFRPPTTTPQSMMALNAESLIPATDFSQVNARRRSSDAPTISEGGSGGSAGVGLAAAAHEGSLNSAAARGAALQNFTQPSDALVSEAYAGLHDPAHAGLVPVALNETTYRGASVPCVVFDWDGLQYTYQPDKGTTGRPLPLNPFTGLPYLCLKNGALAECVYFRATYSRKFPNQKAVVVPGDPAFVAFQTEQNLGLFFPQLGYFTLAKQYRGIVDDREALGKVRTRIVVLQVQAGARADAVPERMPGDDGDLQVRRAFLACREAGLDCHLHEEGPSWFDFAAEGQAYFYGLDQRVHLPASSPAGPQSAGASARSDFQVPAIQPIQLTGPVIPDHEAEMPGLTPVTSISPPSGAPSLTAGSAPAAKNNLVLMPPVIVAATRLAKNPWRYASVPGFEVLSRASQDDTAWDLDGFQHGLWIQSAIIPKEWLPELPVPCTVIIDNTDLDQIRQDQPHSEALKFDAPADPLAWGSLSGRVHDAVEPISTDGDTFSVNSNVFRVHAAGVTCDSLNLDSLLRSTPPLPTWVISGLIGRDGLFRGGFVISIADGGGIGSTGLDPLIPPLVTANVQRRPLNEAAGPGTIWVSAAETQRLLQLLKRDRNTRIPLLPLGELFAEALPPAEKRALWESESGLFLRWGLMGPGHDDSALSQAFLTLVRRARREPVTEKMFTECFGFGYGVMADKLATFLPKALATPTQIRRLQMPYSFPMPKLRAATPDETGRMLGDWIRMQGETLRLHNSATADNFFDAAGQMLWRAYRDDNALPDQANTGSISASQIRDPMLLAIYGLYEFDAGRDDKAREFLTAAVQADVVRPRAYQVLAGLRFAEANARPQGSNGRISRGQAATILEPLSKALRFPASLELYNLMVDTWGRCDAKPATGDLETLRAGTALFPRSLALTFKTALVFARHGYRAQAAELARQGLAFATKPSDRDRLEKLRSILERSPADAAK